MLASKNKSLKITFSLMKILLNTRTEKMNKNLLIAASFLSATLGAQAPIFKVSDDVAFYVDQNALVYNGGGIQTIGAGLYDIRGNVMVVGSSSDVLSTLQTGGAAKTDGGNFKLRLNDPVNYTTSTYGQLYITGLTQANMTAIVDKEYRVAKHGATNYFQQIALPFFDKTLSTLSTELFKTFGVTRFTQNEILKWNNALVVSDHFKTLETKTTDATGYYMLGSKANNFDASSRLYTLKGRPYADDAKVSVTLKDAGKDVVFGDNGTTINQYRERYNSYLQDAFDFGTGAYVNSNYGKNLYQFGNPFFTNLDLSKIGYVEVGAGDGNQLLAIQGIRYDPGIVQTLEGGSTFSTGAKMLTFSSATRTPAGDVNLIIKPMQTFVIKLTATANGESNPVNNVLNFKTLRRFSNATRAEGVKYDVTAAKGTNSGNTLKQLGIKGLDENGNEIARAYYVVYPEATSGHTTNATTQATNSSSNLMGTFEEDAINGGYDHNYTALYWLYINEANEYDFEGKAIPFNIYSDEIKSLKFEILEDTLPIPTDEHRLSTGLGFYYSDPTGLKKEIKQNQTIPVTSSEYNLYYGNKDVLSAIDGAKPSRTMVVFDPNADQYLIKFDPTWKFAEVQVFDTSGRLILSNTKIKTNSDFPLPLSKEKAVYIVKAVSETGVVMSTKILR